VTDLLAQIRELPERERHAAACSSTYLEAAAALDLPALGALRANLGPLGVRVSLWGTAVHAIQREAQRIAKEAHRLAVAEARAAAKAEAEARKAEARAKVIAGRVGRWEDDRLLRDDDGWLLSRDGAGIHNAMVLLTIDEDTRGLFRFNRFRGRIELTRRPPWLPDGAAFDPTWNDGHARLLAAHGADRYSLSARVSEWRAAAANLADADQYHPVQDYLESVASVRHAAGDPTLDTWLVDFYGAPDTEHTRLAGRWFLISAVARGMRPGEKVDSMLILDGHQGKGKSNGMSALFTEEFSTDSSIDWNSKDRFQNIEGRWGCEIAELAGVGKADIDRIKAFITTRRDDYRKPHAHDPVEVQRSCVFFGTVNGGKAKQGYLRDEENRRFWPVAVTREADPARIKAVRDALWGEAYRAWKAGEKWYPDTDELRATFAARVDEVRVKDPWMPLVAKHLEDRLAREGDVETTNAEILINGLAMPAERINQAASTRIGLIMSELGWRAVGRLVDKDSRAKSTVYRPTREGTFRSSDLPEGQGYAYSLYDDPCRARVVTHEDGRFSEARCTIVAFLDASKEVVAEVETEVKGHVPRLVCGPNGCRYYDCDCNSCPKHHCAHIKEHVAEHERDYPTGCQKPQTNGTYYNNDPTRAGRDVKVGPNTWVPRPGEA
jgi:predicted P-loop ATPase